MGVLALPPQRPLRRHRTARCFRLFHRGERQGPGMHSSVTSFQTALAAWPAAHVRAAGGAVPRTGRNRQCGRRAMASVHLQWTHSSGGWHGASGLRQHLGSSRYGQQGRGSREKQRQGCQARGAPRLREQAWPTHSACQIAHPAAGRQIMGAAPGLRLAWCSAVSMEALGAWWAQQPKLRSSAGGATVRQSRAPPTTRAAAAALQCPGTTAWQALNVCVPALVWRGSR